MAFGIKRAELQQWKATVAKGDIAFLTHYWFDPRFPNVNTVTKVGCSDLGKLAAWCTANGLNPDYIHHRQPYPHYDLIGPRQIAILQQEQLWQHLERFKLL
ncbi:hypothetical protein [Paenibacillus sp. FSL H8-0034]|uniref:hypothetical protein n=1 Tax=Paenibacillus sp. FSL H8-0034 TaxID=2954671 RepID=UPI0030FC3EB8